MIEFELSYLLISLIAGFLTVLAPCILPLLPVIIGSSTTSKTLSRPIRIIISLSVSIIVFTLLLKASSALIDIPPKFWTWTSGLILLIYGVVTLFPQIWDKIAVKLKLNSGSNKLLAKGVQKDNGWGDILIGASLGPIFSSCSPTFATIVVAVLPASYLTGLVYLVTYVIGLAIPLLLIATLGQRFSEKLDALSDPKGKFKRIIAIIFIIVGVLIITGSDKKIEAWLIEQGLYDGIIQLEEQLDN